MPADTKYLTKQRQTWYLRMRVPTDLQSRLGKTEIVKSLRTRDLSIAQKARWGMVAEVENLFASLRGEPGAQRKAERDEFHRQLEAWRGQAKASGDPYSVAEIAMDTLHRDDVDAATFHAASHFLDELDAPDGGHVPLPARYRMTVSEASQGYLAEAAKGGLMAQTLGQTAAVCRLLSDFTGSSPLQAVGREQAARFLDTVSRLKATWGRSPLTKSRSLRELLELYSVGPQQAGLSNKTLNRYASSLATVWEWAASRGHVPQGDNPWKGQTRRTVNHRRSGYLPFSDHEVCTVLDHCAGLPVQQAMRWVPLIAAYSGMRSGEICSLLRSDVRKEQGIWFFDITEAKTEAGIRRVPIHSEVIKAGFLDYLEALPEVSQLFPSLRPGGLDRKLNWYFGKQFNALRTRLGVKRPRVAFHSFRKSVGSKLEQARIPESEAVQVLGHEKLSMSYTVYSLGVGLPRLREIVECVDYA